jgi:hypothetical protein
MFAGILQAICFLKKIPEPHMDPRNLVRPNPQAKHLLPTLH